MTQPASFCCKVVLALVAAVLVSAPTAAQNRIAFVNPAGQLVTVAPDGEDLRVLTPPGRQHQFPAWSPVADELAVIGSDPQGGAVFTVGDHAGAEPEQLYRDALAAPIYLYWAPDGQKLGFLASGPNGLSLQVARPDGSSVQNVAFGNPLYWQWNVNASELLVHSGVGSAGQIAFVSETGEAGEPLAEPSLFNAPGVSASGRYLAYGEVVGSSTRIVLRASGLGDGDSVRREVPYEGLAAFSWSPVGERLAIMSPATSAGTPYGPLRLLDAETGELTPLVEATAVAFFWSPDARHIAYFTPFRRGGGQFVDRQTLGTTAEMTAGARLVAQEEALLLELRVVEVASRRSRLLAAFSPTALFLDQFLPFFDQYALSHSLWSPDGSALVLPMQGEIGPQVVVVPLSGEPKALVDGDMAFWSRR